jgi:hypothetical protein
MLRNLLSPSRASGVWSGSTAQQSGRQLPGQQQSSGQAIPGHFKILNDVEQPARLAANDRW